MCPLYEVQRSLPLNVTGFGVAQRVLLYFLNLSRADFWLENTAAFFSLSFLSSSIFILSSIVFLITSWGGEQNRLAKHCRHCWKITKWLHQFYSGLLTLWSSWATCFLRLSTLPAELRPFFLYFGVNFSLASGSKPWEDKNVFRRL